MTVAGRIGLAALLGACFVPCSTGSAWAAPAEAPAEVAAPDGAEPPSGAVPDASAPSDVAADTPAPAEAPGPDAPAETAAPSDAGSVPEAPPASADEAAPAPEESATSETPREGSDDLAADEAENPTAGPEKSDVIDPDLLSGEASEPSPTPPTTRRTVQDPGAYETAMLAAYDADYRPAHNPGRLNINARLLFANAGGDGEIGGRMGGAQVDVGQSWNHFGYAITGSAWGGRILMGDRVAEMNGLFGAGPTINFGRTALQQRGMIDLRLGYDFMYGVVNQRADTGTVLAPANDNSSVRFEQAENLMPHGPRAMLQLGLLSPVKRNYHHGMGIVFGYQGLVGSLRGELPFTHMLVTGIQWWMG